MKYSVLKRVEEYLREFRTISTAYRVEDTIIKIVFDRDETLFFDMRRGDSYIFKKEDYKRQKIYNAPFDVVLYKRFAKSKLLKVEVLEGNRVLRIEVDSKSSYKSQKSILQLEFTGRNTNAIILDENGVVIEALRHIDSSVSYRSVKSGEKLKPLPPYEINEKEDIDTGDIKEYLENEYQKRIKQKVESKKVQKIAYLDKRIKKLQKIQNSLSNEEDLLKKAEIYNYNATLILSNLHLIESYAKEVQLKDWDGKSVKIELPKEAKTPSQAANIFFSKSKKLKQKASSLHKERENLKEKIDFLENLKRAVKFAKDEDELNILLPKQRLKRKEKSDSNSYESFYMEGYKIMVGKSEKGNIMLLKEAKKRDIWLHLKDIPSTHVIIRTDKQSIPDEVLKFGAKLCVDFSVTSSGVYLVDYTQRRNVTVVSGANVTYTDYKTISVKKE